MGSRVVVDLPKAWRESYPLPLRFYRGLSNCSDSKIGVIGGINDKPVNISVFEWLTPQIKYRRMHIEEVSKAELACLCSGGACLAFCFRPSDPVACKSKMGCDFPRSIILRLPCFDRAQRFLIGDCMVVRVQLPQGTHEADSPSCAIELKLVFRGFCEMDFARSCGKTRPSEPVCCTKRSQLRKITGRIFRES